MSKRDRFPLAALMILALALWIPWMRGPIDLRWDAAVYYILGTSLSEGEGYRLLNEPGDPEAVQYPPLLPLFIAAQERLLGTSDFVLVGKWLRVQYQLMLMGCAALTYLIAVRWLSRLLAFVAAVMFLLSLHTYFMGSLAFAEMPFTFASLLFLSIRRSRRIGQIWCGLWAIAAYLLRSIGIVLLVTWVVEAVIRAKWKAGIARAVVVLLPIIVWQGYVHHVENSQNYQHPAYLYQRAPYQFYNVPYSRNVAYVDPFRPELGLIDSAQLLHRVFTNLLLERRSFPEAVTTNLGFWHTINSWIRVWIPARLFQVLVAALAYTIAFLMLIGFMSMTLSGEVQIPIYVALAAIAIAATPWPAQFSRYFWPLSPLLAIALMVGVDRTRKTLGRATRGRWRWLASGCLVLIVAAAISTELAVMMFNWVRPDFKYGAYLDQHQMVHHYRLLYYDQHWQTFDQAVAWIKRETPPNAVVATSCPHYLYLTSGHKAVMPPMEKDPATAKFLLGNVPATYLIADDLTFMGDIVRTVVKEVTQLYPTDWKTATMIPNSDTIIFQRIGNVSQPNAVFRFSTSSPANDR